MLDHDEALILQYLYAQGRERRALRRRIAQEPEIVLGKVSQIWTGFNPLARRDILQDYANKRLYLLVRDTCRRLLADGWSLNDLQKHNMLDTLQIIGMLQPRLEYKGSMHLTGEMLASRLRSIEGIDRSLRETAITDHFLLLHKLKRIPSESSSLDYVKYQELSGRWKGLSLYRSYNEALLRTKLDDLQGTFDFCDISTPDDRLQSRLADTNPTFAYGGFNALEFLQDPEVVRKYTILVGMENVRYSYVLFTPSQLVTKDVKLYLTEGKAGIKEGERQIDELIRNSSYFRISSTERESNRFECAKEASSSNAKRVETPVTLGSDGSIQLLDVLGFNRVCINGKLLRMGGLGLFVINREFFPQIKGFVKALFEQLTTTDATEKSCSPLVVYRIVKINSTSASMRNAQWDKLAVLLR